MYNLLPIHFNKLLFNLGLPKKTPRDLPKLWDIQGLFKGIQIAYL
jgi:hypothetical protein